MTDLLEDRSARIAAVGYDYAAHETRAGRRRATSAARADTVEVSRRDRYGYPASLRVCAPLRARLPLAAADAPPSTARFYEDVYRPLVTAYHGRRIDAETVQDEQRAYAAELVEFLRDALPAPPAHA